MIQVWAVGDGTRCGQATAAGGQGLPGAQAGVGRGQGDPGPGGEGARGREGGGEGGARGAIGPAGGGSFQGAGLPLPGRPNSSSPRLSRRTRPPPLQMYSSLSTECHRGQWESLIWPILR